METYLLTYLGSAFLALTVTPLVIRFANRFNMVDIPGARHMHKKPVPRIGGVAIFLSAIAGTVGVLLFSDVGSAESGGALGKVIVLLFAAGLVFFVGLVDDIKTGGLAAGMKLLAQIIAALAVCAVGIRIRSVTVVEGFTLDFGWFSWPLTLLWIVGITNAVNLSDGLDGLAAGISAVACSVIAIFAMYSGHSYRFLSTKKNTFPEPKYFRFVKPLFFSLTLTYRNALCLMVSFAPASFTVYGF